MVNLAPSTGPFGAQFRNEECFVKAAAALSVGDLVTLSSEDTSHPIPFDTATVAGAEDDDIHIIYGIVTAAAAAAGDKVRVLLKGVVKATTDGNTADADKLSAGAGVLVDSDAEGVATGTQKVLAIALETDSSDNEATVLFDGVNGFGSIGNAG
ncbi:MAG: hypothetical protein ACO3O3_07255 [Ilumatobacteraceae bacterium]